MSSDGIKIGVEVVGAAQAADQLNAVAKASERAEESQSQATEAVVQSQKQQGESTETAAAQIEALGDKSERAAQQQQTLANRAGAARNTLEGLRQIAAGGEMAFAGWGKAVDSALTAVGVAGKWAGVVTIIGTVVSAGMVLKGMFDDIRATGVRAAEDAQKRWQTFAEWLGQRREEKFSDALEAIRSKAQDAREEVEALLNARDRLDNAEMAAEIAALNADDSIAPEDKALKELEIRNRFARRSEDRRMGVIDEPVKAAQSQYDEMVAQRQDRAARAAQMRAQVDREQAEVDAARRDRDEVDKWLNENSPSHPLWHDSIKDRKNAEDFLSANDSELARKQREDRLKLAEQDELASAEPNQAEREAQRTLERERRRADEERRVQTEERRLAEQARGSAMTAAQRTARRAEIQRSRTPVEEYDRDVGERDGRRLGALEQARMEEIAKALVAGAGTTKGRAIQEGKGEAAELARLLQEAARATQGEATAGEMGALADAIRALLQSQEAKDLVYSRTLINLERQVRALSTRGAAGRNTP